MLLAMLFCASQMLPIMLTTGSWQSQAVETGKEGPKGEI